MGLTGDVHVEIDELVLDGFDHRVDADLVTEAFSAELLRLVRLRGLPTSGPLTELPALPLTELPALPPGASASPERLGVALARSVHAGLSQGRPR